MLQTEERNQLICSKEHDKWYQSRSDPSEWPEDSRVEPRNACDICCSETLSRVHRTLKVTVYEVKYIVTEEILHQVFDGYGNVESIAILQVPENFQALVTYEHEYSADSARRFLHGRYIYDGGNVLDVKYFLEGLHDEVSKIKTRLDKACSEMSGVSKLTSDMKEVAADSAVDEMPVEELVVCEAKSTEAAEVCEEMPVQEVKGCEEKTMEDRACIPLALTGRNICGSAFTGSGKTAVFALPTLERLLDRGGTIKERYDVNICPSNVQYAIVNKPWKSESLSKDASTLFDPGGISYQLINVICENSEQICDKSHKKEMEVGLKSYYFLSESATSVFEDQSLSNLVGGKYGGLVDIFMEKMLEVDCPIVTPEVVLKVSGHVDKFTDLMVKDEKTGTCYRADHLLKDQCKEKLAKELSLTTEKAAELKHVLAILEGKANDFISSFDSCKKNIHFQRLFDPGGTTVVDNLLSSDDIHYMLGALRSLGLNVEEDKVKQRAIVGGILMCTATDMAVLCGGNGEVCYSKYGSYPLRGKYCHEMALRILLACIESPANRYKRYIVPVLSVQMDFYCIGCDSFHLQPIGRTVSKNISVRYLPGFGPVVTQDCSDCGKKYNMGGPIWSAPIHDMKWVNSILADVKSMKDRYPAFDRISAVLTTISEELPDVPLFLSLHNLCGTLKCTSPSAIIFRSAVINAGYRISGSHVNPLSLKTDAPMDVIWDIMRCWVKDHPVKAQPADMSGSIILAKEPENMSRCVQFRCDFLLRWRKKQCILEDKDLLKGGGMSCAWLLELLD